MSLLIHGLPRHIWQGETEEEGASFSERLVLREDGTFRHEVKHTMPCLGCLTL